MSLSIPVQIVRYTDDSFPGWVECVLRDASDREWRFIDKVPAFTLANLPQSGSIACEIVREWVDEDGRERCLIDTTLPWGIDSVDGQTHFEVFRDEVKNSDG